MSTTDFPELEEVEEDAVTLEENALKKAKYVAMVTGLPSLADDTGLEVVALMEHQVFILHVIQANMLAMMIMLRNLLSEMSQTNERNAQFRTVVAFVDTNKQWIFEGICTGKIYRFRKGAGGFGYDPIFIPDGFDMSFAEMDSEQKNSISHRGLAMKKAVAFLQQWA